MQDKNLNKEIQRTFNNFETGFIKDRYISELDLMLYLAASTILYALIIWVITINILNINYWLKAIIAITALYFVFYKLTDYIYYKAPLKEKWKNKKIEENKTVISKRMKMQFLAFMIIALMFGTMEGYFGYFLILTGLYIIIVFIKIYFLYKKEKGILG